MTPSGLNKVNQPWLWAALSVVWVGVIYALSDRPAGDFEDANETVSWLPFASFVVHIVLYAVLSAFVLRTLILLRKFTDPLISYAVIFTALIYGILDEIHQSSVEGRSSEAADVVADVFGALLVVIFWFLQKRYRAFRARERDLNSGD